MLLRTSANLVTMNLTLKLLILFSALVQFSEEQVQPDPDSITFPKDSGEIFVNPRMNYRAHQHHHHNHDETFFLPPKETKGSMSGTNKNNYTEIPLTLIQELNEIDDLFMLSNYLEGDAEFMEEINIKSRFGDVERAAVIIPKPAKCMPTLKEIELKNSNDSTYFYYPSCTRIERCGGCCSHSLLSCQPTETETVTFQVIVSQYTGGTKLTLKGKDLIQVEKHTKCKCDCTIKKEDCNSFQEYRKDECRCICMNLDERRKCDKNNNTRLWDPRDCTCKCREVSECSTGLFFDNNRCACVSIPVRRRFAELNSSNERSFNDREAYEVDTLGVAPLLHSKYDENDSS